MGLDIENVEGQTPLDEDEKDGLLIRTITTRSELDQLEQLNIEKAIIWLIRRNLRKDRILSEDFVKELHTRMFGEVWDWAGTFRKTDKNLGVEWIHIEVELRKLIDNTCYLIDRNLYGHDEIAIRFKHRLVQIHCFPNGNRRHSRLMADIIVEKIFREEVFPWKRSILLKSDKIRREYINAIQQADQGIIRPLIDFARS
jgi:Fic-DOC domain mobile mystery protein B